MRVMRCTATCIRWQSNASCTSLRMTTCIRWQRATWDRVGLILNVALHSVGMRGSLEPVRASLKTVGGELYKRISQGIWGSMHLAKFFTDAATYAKSFVMHPSPGVKYHTYHTRQKVPCSAMKKTLIYYVPPARLPASVRLPCRPGPRSSAHRVHTY